MLSKETFKRIAHLHIQGITTGFLSTLGVPFLSYLYRAIVSNPFSSVFVSMTDKDGALQTVQLSKDCVIEAESIEGFIACSLDTRKMYRYIIGHHFVGLSLRIAAQLLKVKNSIRIIETLQYGKRKNSQEVDNVTGVVPELLSIAIDEKVRGKGIGKTLVKVMEKYLLENYIDKYKVVTFSQDEKSNAFYKSCGFTFNREFVHHDNVMNEYVKRDWEKEC